MRTRRRRRNRRRGSAVVEFAITLPILIMFLIFMWEFSRAEMIRQTSATAAYEGARQAIVVGGSTNDVEQTVTSIMQAVGIRDAKVVVTPSVITSATAAVEVTVDVPLAGNAWITPLFFQDMTIHSTMTLLR